MNVLRQMMDHPVYNEKLIKTEKYFVTPPIDVFH